MTIKKLIKRFIPQSIWSWAKMERNKYCFNQHYGHIAKRIRRAHKQINVLFLATESAKWKYDGVYELMRNCQYFNPTILICPIVNKGKDFMIASMEKSADFFHKKGWPYIKSYSQQNDSYLNPLLLNPDVVFFPEPYVGLMDSRYDMDVFCDSLTCYVNYGFINVNYPWAVGLPFHGKVWRYFIECNSNYLFAKSLSPIKGINCKVVGYPSYDILHIPTTDFSEWKFGDSKRKRIIWSPHHSILNTCKEIQVSTFLLYYDVMLALAHKYKDEIEIAFKPHPLLKPALYSVTDWGKQRTDSYYQQWALGENTSLHENEYVNLFRSSNAIINDSASFTIEYLYTKNPALYLNNFDRTPICNEVGKAAFDAHYHATTPNEIEEFILKVVINGDDPLRVQRESFFENYLLPPNKSSVAENIVNEIISVCVK